ncbi:keratin, type II cytoskeletal 1-like [Impatiens glandulifera]|uniref:keratin, type II cytoskeletal 1-like n=1 Tax=Impatiens glandulifera TaxID=253017 RepID=UPI001FB078A0|nr:keratin, type II cytoskeletal 1-like [Impatiens glandulifera]
MRSARQTGGIVIGEPRPAPKPIEVIGKGKKIVTQVPEKVSEATCIFDLIIDQVKAITAEKLEIFESWSLERLSSKYNDTLTNSVITREWKKWVANEKKVFKWARTSEVAEALKRKDLVEACMSGKALFPILEARKANFNPVEKGSEVEMKVLKKLNDIMDGYVSVVTRYVHGANCSEEEELIVQEPKQALETNEEEVLVEDVIEEVDQAPLEEDVVITSVVRTKEAQEKVAEVTQLETIRSEGEPSKEKVVEEERSPSEEKRDQHTTYKKPRLFPDTIMRNVHENINIPLHYSGNLYERFQRAEEELLEEEKDEAAKKCKKFQTKENAKANVEKEQPRPAQGESSRRNDGVSTSTRSRRAPSNDDKPRPTKRGGGRSGNDRGGRNSGGVHSRLSNVDQGGRASGNDRGGRSSGGGRGGRGYPPYLNMLHGQDMSPTDPRVKR